MRSFEPSHTDGAAVLAETFRVFSWLVINGHALAGRVRCATQTLCVCPRSLARAYLKIADQASRQGAGQEKFQALCGVMRKYFIGLWACVKNHTPFGPVALFSDVYLKKA